MKLINDVLMFLVEIAMVALFLFGGYQLVQGDELMRWGVGGIMAAAALSFWSWKLAPKARERLKQPVLAGAKIGLFVIAALIGVNWDHAFAAVFVAIATITAVGEYMLGSNSDSFQKM